MRTIAIASVVLVAVSAGVTQNAIEAPYPPGASATDGFAQHVACASAKSCGAIGTWLYSKQDGKWKAATVPVLAGTGGTTLLSLACPAAGKCEAVGRAGEQHVVRAGENGRQWTLAELGLPANAAPIKLPKGPFPSLESVSCSSSGNCGAVGHYAAADHTTHALLFGEDAGTWGAATDVPLPPDASTTFPPPESESFAGGFLSFVSCPSDGNCSTVGSYTRTPTASAYPWIFDETGGHWSPAGVGLQLPAGAATTVDSRGGGGSPFLGFSGLSCSSAGNCTAVGGYVDRHSDFQGVIFAEHDGTWSRGVKAPVPAGAGNYTDAMELVNPLNAVSCATASDCAAIGSFVKSGVKGDSETPHALLLAEHQGEWKASAISLPRRAGASGGVYLNSVSCPASGNCVAVGYYASHGKTHGLVVRERGGKWARATNAAVPKGAAPASRSHTFLNSVSCTSASSCTAGGYYNDRSGTTQGLLLELRLG